MCVWLTAAMLAAVGGWADAGLGAQERAMKDAAEFNCQIATMTVGRDGKVYLTSLWKKEPGGFLLRVDLEGAVQTGGVVTNQMGNATASAAGVMATANMHFARKVTLWDADFHVVGAMVKISGWTFRAPLHVEAGAGGDFYTLDNDGDRVVRFRPDGMRTGTYLVPREPAGPGGEPRDFRVCERTGTLYVLTSGGDNPIRCFSMGDGTAWKTACRELWRIKSPVGWGEPHIGGGGGGFDVDDDGVLYVKDRYGGPVKRYDAAGKPLADIQLKITGEQLPIGPERGFRYMRIVAGQAVLNRQHVTELFQRYDLGTGELKGVVHLGKVVPPPAGTAVAMPKPVIDKPAAGEPAPLRVLFVGNSQVNCVSDIAEIVEDLSHSAPAGVPRIQADEVVMGGAGLSHLWADGLARRKIEVGRYDVVVLQEMIGVAEGQKDNFLKHARLFAQAVTAAGARPLLFVTAHVEAKKAAHEVMYAANLEAAHELKCRLAGAGMAWLKAWDKDPKLDLHHTDRAHPNLKGYYLNACVIYAALTDATPVGLEGFGLPAADAQFLQTVAWEQAKEDRAKEKLSP
jgi:hypothetical protein